MYGFILLYCFIASLLINPFLVLALGRENFAYELPTGNEFSPQLERLYKANDYQDKTWAEHNAIQTEADRIELLGFTALLGWMVTSKRFRRGANYYWQKAFQRDFL